MTDKYIKKGNTYGGELNEYDFNTTSPTRFSSPSQGSDIARRIIACWRFDEERRKEAENRDNHVFDQSLRKDEII